MLKLSRFCFVWIALLFLQEHSLAERASHQKRSQATTQTPTPNASRPVTESQSGDDWCHGQLNEDEKRKIKEELAAVYSKYQKSRDQQGLEGDLTRLFENNSGSQNKKKQAELAALMGQAVKDLAQVTRFYDSLSALEKGEPAPAGKTSEEWESLKKDYEELKKLGFKFDGEKGQWDLSGLTEKNIDLSAASPESKKSMERLLSPDIAEKFFDPNRRDAFDLGDYVIRPPQANQSSELTVTTKEQHEKGVRETIDRLMTEKEEFLKASKEANSFMNSFRGSLLPVLGFERGHNGQSASEIQREGSYKAMQSLVQRLRNTFGVSPETLSALNSVLFDALKQDSQGLAALDGKLTQAITALKTARNIAVVGGALLATGGLAAPGVVAGLLGAGTTGVMAGATTGAVGTAMAAAVGMSAIPAAINIGVDVTNGKKLSCSAMDQLVERGPQAVSSAMMAAAFAGGGGALGLYGAKLLAGASPYVGQAAAGLIGSGAQMGTGTFFLGMGANGVYQNGRAAYQLFQEANEAEARGDVATAKELRAEAVKLAAETGVNAIETAYGATQLARGAQKARQDYKRARRVEKAEKLVGPLSPEKVVAIEEAHRVGEGQLGRDGKTPAAIDNYTDAQLRQKAEILKAAGFTKNDRRLLMEGEIVGAPRNPSTRTVRTPPPEVAASKINLNRMGSRSPATEEAPLSSSSAAKSEAKYRAGIPKEQKPSGVHEETIYLPGGETKKVVQEFYEVDLGPGIGKVDVILMEHSAGNGHKHPHWEVGLPKSDVTGRLDLGEGGERAGGFVYHSENKLRVFFDE